MSITSVWKIKKLDSLFNKSSGTRWLIWKHSKVTKVCIKNNYYIIVKNIYSDIRYMDIMREWDTTNLNSINALGQQTSYKL